MMNILEMMLNDAGQAANLFEGILRSFFNLNAIVRHDFIHGTRHGSIGKVLGRVHI